MQEDGTLAEYLDKIEEEYSERFSRVEDELLEKTQLEIRYGRNEIDWQTYVGEFNQIRENIRELLANELCC